MNASRRPLGGWTMRMRRERSRLRARVAVLLAATLLASCAPAASPSPSGGWIARWEPRNAWERALAAIDPQTGSFARDDALRLFATAFGPLPGVDVQQDLTGVHDRTIAIAAVMAHESELTSEQRAAIDGYLAPPAESERIVLGNSASALTASADESIAGAAMARARGVSAFAPGLKEALKQAAEGFKSQIGALLGDNFPGQVTIILAPQPQNQPRVLGEAWSDWPGGAFNNCEITIYARATDHEPIGMLTTLAHELFHCFQFHGYHFLGAYADAPQWIIEGQANYVGGLLTAGLDDQDDDDWQRYLTMPWLPLTGRAYDAIGFYAHLAESGTDPWSRFRAMWAAGGDSAAAFVNADAEGPIFLESWGSSIVREPGRGEKWDTMGPGITEDSYFLRPPTIIGDGDVVRINTPAFTADAFQYEASADLIRFDIPGNARLSDGRLDTPELAGVTYCVEGHECVPVTCPGDAAPREYPTIGSHFVVGIAGGIKPMTGTIRGIEAGSGDECEEDPDDDPPPPPPPGGFDPPGGNGGPPPDRDACQTRCGRSNGDVHIATFGEHGYEFQAVGEFVLARSLDGQFEVQVRQAPFGDSRNVSINTAVAVRAGDHRMGLYVDPLTSAVRLTVDGQEAPYDMEAAVAFGRGFVVPYSRGVRIDTGDGSHVYVVGLSQRGFNLLVEPGEAREARIAGLMGANPPGSLYPALPDGGSVGPISFDRHEDYVQLYQILADAWRVTPASSLFDYGPGEWTETFTDRIFPSEADLLRFEDLTEAQKAAGEAACAAVTDPDLHRMCVYDVGITADPGYAETYEDEITLLETGSLGASGERVRVVNLYANEGVGTAIDVYAWAGDATNLAPGSGTAPALVATVPYGQASDWFDPGKMANGPFAPVNWISIQRSGEPINTWGLNLFDAGRDSVDGLSRVLLVTSARAGTISVVGGTAMTHAPLLEDAPEEYFPLIEAPTGAALGFLNVVPMYEIEETLTYAASVDGRCLSDPDFPSLARAAQGTSSFALVLQPGSHEVAVHEWPAGADGFDLDCGRFPVAARAEVSVQAGDRVHLFTYTESRGSQVRLLAVPFGD